MPKEEHALQNCSRSQNSGSTYYFKAVTITCLKGMRFYNVMIIENLLIKKDAGQRIKFSISITDTYGTIKWAHPAIGHCGMDRMLKEVEENYANITEYVLQLFKCYCQE